MYNLITTDCDRLSSMYSYVVRGTRMTRLIYVLCAFGWLQGSHGGAVDDVKRYLINYPHLFDYGQTIFCLSFPSRDRATAPGRYEQFYFTEHVPYPQKIHFEDAIRSEDPVQLFCNSFCVQHKMVGDDYPSILQCLVYCHSAD